jgi:hypothetical protein
MQNRRAIALSTAVLLAACAKAEAPKADTAAAKADSAAVAPAPAAPAPLALADVAGTWKLHNVPATGPDTVATDAVLKATADTSGWSITLPNGAKSPLHVVVAGDSIVSTSDVYSSARRKGAKVFTVTTMRLQNGALVGQTVAHYKTDKPDSVLVLKMDGTKQ